MPSLPAILLVDPDKEFLGVMGQALGRDFEVHTARAAKAALEQARNARLAVVVVNPVLPDMSGVDLLNRLAELKPDISRLAVLDDHDGDMLVRLVNEVGVMGLLVKPVQPRQALEVVRRGQERHMVCVQERLGLQETMRGSVKVLLDLMEVLDPSALGRSRRVRKRALELGRRLKAASAWRLEMAVMLSHIGCMVLPNEITRKLDDGRDLTVDEQKLFFRHPAIAAKLLSNIKRMDSVAQAVLHQNAKFSKDIPLESRILKVVLDLDRQERKGLETAESVMILKKRGELYDPDVLAALDEILDTGGGAVREVAVADLEPGMVMARDLKTGDGVVLLLKGQHLTKASAARLKLFAGDLGLPDSVAVEEGRTVDVSAEADVPDSSAAEEARAEDSESGGQGAGNEKKDTDGKAGNGQ